jgi:hypothetical protein
MHTKARDNEAGEYDEEHKVQDKKYRANGLKTSKGVRLLPQ